LAASVLVKAGRLLDVREGGYIENAGIWIEGDRIKELDDWQKCTFYLNSVR
jgi:hypothetical protein